MVDMTPWIGVISSIVGWGFFIIVLAMLKNFISTGVSYALAEILLKQLNQEQREKLVRWFGNSDVILERLEEIEEKLERNEEAAKSRGK